VPGQSQGQAVTLEKKYFKQLSSDQEYLETTRKFARKDGTICGLNPLKL
jgi:DNA polymerase I-like protein with 3'-5' exonuclease and polymerase domains